MCVDPVDFEGLVSWWPPTPLTHNFHLHFCMVPRTLRGGISWNIPFKAECSKRRSLTLWIIASCGSLYLVPSGAAGSSYDDN